MIYFTLNNKEVTLYKDRSSMVRNRMPRVIIIVGVTIEV